MPTHDLRQQLRYDADVKVLFNVAYSFRTEVDFSLDEQTTITEKHIGFSKNISVFGLCLESNKELRVDDRLCLEVHLPDSDEIIHMQGVVRWTQVSEVLPQTPKMYLMGIVIDVVDDIAVQQTVYYDQTYGIYWSELLERVLGSFAQLYKTRSTITVLRGILRDDNGRYLMLKRAGQCKRWPFKWEFPGGKVDPGERPTTTLKREFLEEVSVEIKPLQRFLDFVYEEPDGNIEYQLFFVEKVSGAPLISDEHMDIGWFTLDEMKNLDISPPLLDAIEHLRNPV